MKRVTGKGIEDGSIESADLAPGALGLQSGDVTTDYLADGAVTPAKLSDASKALGSEIGDFKFSALAADHNGWLVCDGRAVSRSTYTDLYAALGDAFGAGDGATTFNLPSAAGRVALAAGSGQRQLEIAAASAAADTLTIPSNADFLTGRAVVYTSSGDEIGGLTSGATYYLIRVDATTVKLAASRADAIKGVAIDLTSAGTGTQLLTHSLTTRALGDVGGEEAHSLLVDEIPAHGHPVATGGGSVGSGFSDGSGDTTGDAGGSGEHATMPPFLAVGNLFIYSGVSS